MSHRDRLFNVATGIAIFSLLAFCLMMAGLEYAYDDSGNPGAHSAYAAEHLKEAASAGLFEIQAAAPDNRSASEQYHERQDLAAQRGMAYIAALQVAISAFGLYFLIRTLEYTADATRAAAEAAQAANKSLELTERDLSERERPRLFIAYSDDDLFDDHPEEYTSITPSVWFRLRNVGERAAIAYKAFTSIHVGPARVRPKPSDPMEAGAYPSIMEDTLVEPSQGEGVLLWAQSKRRFTAEEREQIRARTHFVYVRAVVFFRDHLGDSRVFGFCQAFSGALPRRIGGSEDGITFLEYTYERKLPG